MKKKKIGYPQRIIDVLSSAGKPLTQKTLAQRMKVAKKSRASFENAIDRLVEEGRLRVGRAGRLSLRQQKKSSLITGVLKRIRSGAGYVIPNDGDVPGIRGAKDVFVEARDVGDAQTGDEVLVKLSSRRRSGGQRIGRIEQVIERATSVFVGTYFVSAGQGFVRIDGTAFADPVAVGDPGAKGAQPDDKVVIEMLRFPSQQQPGEAVLTEVLGPRGEPGVDTQGIIHEFGLPDEFPEEVLDEARKVAKAAETATYDDRVDLTGETIITIDPKTARDFDDAISLERTDDGHWHLGVHIADVAHFVRRGGALDTEAEKRGTSVYLPQTVIPMLPELLSNGLASLQQGKLRVTKSVFIEYSAEGIPVHTRFENTVIKVKKRFAYEQVMPLLEDPKNSSTRVTAKVLSLLQRMHELAMLLRRRRFEKGALSMGLPEVKLDFDTDGQIIGAHEAEHDESHEIIEEFMLAANIAVAVELMDRSIGYLRRIHGEPAEPKLKAFGDFVNALGFKLKKHRSRRELQKLIDHVQGTRHEHAVNYALLRSLKQAEYSPMDTGHFALAVDDYCHFTSPIRRYPDLIIHRLIDQLIRGRGRKASMSDTELVKLGRHCSTTERRAERAERELTKIKLLRYMATRVGETMNAVVTGVEPFGVFCQGVDIPAEGFIHVSELPTDQWQFDTASFALVGHRRGNEFRLGDPISVVISSVDIDRRQLELRVAEGSAKKSRKRTSSESPPLEMQGRSKSSSRKKPAGKKKASSSRAKTTQRAGKKKASGQQHAGNKKSSRKKKRQTLKKR